MLNAVFYFSERTQLSMFQNNVHTQKKFGSRKKNKEGEQFGMLRNKIVYLFWSTSVVKRLLMRG